MTFPGRLLGIDHGVKVIGLAICDATGLIARPLQVLERGSKREDFAQINRVNAEREIVGVVVGLPVSPPEITVYTQADQVRRWASRLAAAITVPVYLWNERYSSQEAEDILAATRKSRPDRIDDVAAAVILQSFLDTWRDEGIDWPDPVPPAEESA
jgi:putative Holliday junction resolvase